MHPAPCPAVSPVPSSSPAVSSSAEASKQAHVADVACRMRYIFMVPLHHILVHPLHLPLGHFQTCIRPSALVAFTLQYLIPLPLYTSAPPCLIIWPSPTSAPPGRGRGKALLAQPGSGYYGAQHSSAMHLIHMFMPYTPPLIWCTALLCHASCVAPVRHPALPSRTLSVVWSCRTLMSIPCEPSGSGIACLMRAPA